MVGMEGNDLIADLDAFLAARAPELIEFRRDLHAHPEPGNSEYRTTRQVAERLIAAGLSPVLLPGGQACSPTSALCTKTPIIQNGRWLLSGPTSMPCRWRTRRTCPTGPPCLAPATRAATTCTRRSCSAPGCSSPARRGRGCCPAGSASSSSPPRRSTPAP